MMALCTQIFIWVCVFGLKSQKQLKFDFFKWDLFWRFFGSQLRYAVLTQFKIWVHSANIPVSCFWIDTLHAYVLMFWNFQLLICWSLLLDPPYNKQGYDIQNPDGFSYCIIGLKVTDILLHQIMELHRRGPATNRATPLVQYVFVLKISGFSWCVVLSCSFPLSCKL